MDVFVLREPIKINDDLVRELEYDFDALSGRDLRDVSRALKGKGVGVTMPPMDFDFQMGVFAQSVTKCDPEIAEEDVWRMKAPDTMRAAMLAGLFLRGSGSDTEETSGE